MKPETFRQRLIVAGLATAICCLAAGVIAFPEFGTFVVQLVGLAR